MHMCMHILTNMHVMHAQIHNTHTHTHTHVNMHLAKYSHTMKFEIHINLYLRIIGYTINFRVAQNDSLNTPYDAHSTVTLQKHLAVVFIPCSAVHEVSMYTHSMILYSVKC